MRRKEYKTKLSGVFFVIGDFVARLIDFAIWAIIIYMVYLFITGQF